jgi:hypothetical protein
MMAFFVLNHWFWKDGFPGENPGTRRQIDVNYKTGMEDTEPDGADSRFSEFETMYGSNSG